MSLTRLTIVFFASLIIAYGIDRRDQRLSSAGDERKERILTWLLILVLGFFCGLRTSGNDTVTYKGIYEQIPLWDEFIRTRDFDFAHGIGFLSLTSILKTIGFTMQDYLMFYAFATVIPYVLFVRRYSVNMLFGVFLMFTTGFYTFALAAIKQTMATGICLCALPFALDKKWIKFLLTIGLASMFHPYALVYLVVPLMMFEPWRGKTAVYVFLFVAVGFMLEGLIGTVLDITTAMGADYSQAELMGAGVNIFRVLVCFVPLGLAMFYGNAMFQNTSREVHLMFNLAMVNALIMFVGIFGTANYFARLANYFLPAQVVILPWMLYSAHPRDRRWMIPACVCGYLLYFYYENAIIRPFDTGYSHMSFFTYLWDVLGRIFA